MCWAGSTSTCCPAGSACRTPGPWRSLRGRSPGACWSSSASRSPRATSPAASASAARGGTGTRTGSCPASARGRSTACCSTIVVLFALQGDAITNRPLDVARIAVPLVIYFALMWAGSMLLAHRLGLGYARSTSVAFTAAGNNFELAIAVTIAVYGVTERVGLWRVSWRPLIEVPVLVGLVYVSLWARRFFPDRDHLGRTPDDPHPHPDRGLRLRPQRRAVASRARVLTEHYAQGRVRALPPAPSRGAHPPRGRGRPRSAGPGHLAGTAHAPHRRDDRRRRPRRHPRLRRGSARTSPASAHRDWPVDDPARPGRRHRPPCRGRPRHPRPRAPRRARARISRSPVGRSTVQLRSGLRRSIRTTPVGRVSCRTVTVMAALTPCPEPAG